MFVFFNNYALLSKVGDHTSKPTGATVGLAVGAVLLIFVSFVAVYLYCKRKSPKSKDDNTPPGEIGQ
jgi:hypothetical protein